jgi:hypothetical protein
MQCYKMPPLSQVTLRVWDVLFYEAHAAPLFSVALALFHSRFPCPPLYLFLSIFLSLSLSVAFSFSLSLSISSIYLSICDYPPPTTTTTLSLSWHVQPMGGWGECQSLRIVLPVVIAA